MKKTIALTILSFVIGIGLGIIGTIAYSGYELARGMFILQDMELMSDENCAIQAYLNEAPEVGIWALENYIKAIKRVMKERKVDNNKPYFFMIEPEPTLRFAYVRLALLYEKTGDDSKRKENFEKAFEYCDSMKIEREHLEEKLIEIVTKLDSQFEPLDNN
jgi:hypothetical protein